MRNISIRKMWVFICSVEQGSFTEGARRSNISQPAAASIISEIEETVGELLFERSGKTRRATLTARGQEVYETFVRTLAVYERALETISAGKQRKAQKILIQSPYVASVSAHWLRKIIAEEDDAQLSIRSAGWQEIVTAIENREDCMALLDGDVRLRNSEYISIGNVEMVFIVPETNRHFEMNAKEIMWEDVPAETLIYSDICPAVLERTYENLRIAQNTARSFTEVNCTTILRNFCQKTGAPAIAPKNLIDVVGSEVPFRYLSFSYSKLMIPLGLAFSHGNRMRKEILGTNVENLFEKRFYI